MTQKSFILKSFRMVAPSLVLLSSFSAYAERTVGQVQASYTSPNQVEENCSIPRVLDLDASLSGTEAFQAFRDSEMKTATKVCRADFYDRRQSVEGNKAVVTCGKFGSTNPALMFHELPVGMTRADFEKNECPKVKGRAGDMIAKFKSSISCSYTPSILSYPRIARMMKSEIELPFTAYRTMDLKEHLKFATEAKDTAAKVAGYDDLIAQTWRMFYRSDLNPAANGSKLYTKNDKGDFSQVFGALVPELKGDEIYWAANGSTKGDRLKNFQVTDAFAKVTKSAPVSAWGLSKSFESETTAELILLREMGDLIVLDSLLNQQDRFGNLHFRQHYVKMQEDGSLDWKLAKAKKDVLDADQAAEMKAGGYQLVKRMLMADNDCGVAKENKMASAGIAAKVTHLHPDTYHAVQAMQKLAEKGVLAKYLKEDLVFNGIDVRSVQGNLAKMAATFKQKCLNGTLHLDADLAQYLGKKPAVADKTLCE